MAAIEYKILFEVRLLHDYYLSGLEPNGGNSVKSYFAMSKENQKARLAELLNGQRYNIGNDLDVVTSTIDKSLFNKLRMKLVKTATGFFLGVQVERVQSSGGETHFRPVIIPPKDTVLTFGLSIKRSLFGAISNFRLDRDVDNIYLFTNEGPHDGFSLASPINTLVPGQKYRMGDLARVSGSLKQAMVDNVGNARSWSPVEGKGLIHQGDRTLSPDEDWYSSWRKTINIRSKHPAGVIRISLMSENDLLSPINSDFKLTTRHISGKKSINNIIYDLNWLSRPTYWRYSKKNGFSADERIHIMSKSGASLIDSDGKFVTKEPLPITREPPLSPWPNTSIRLPHAQPGLIKVKGGKVFSDIEFNELNPIP